MRSSQLFSAAIVAEGPHIAMDFIKSVSEGLSTLSNLAPYHMIGYSTLLGTTIYQTFVVTKVCYLELPMSAFTTLQKRLFPIYFRSQSLLLLCTALTIPPAGPVSLIQKKADWIPLAFASVMAGFNLIVYGPRVEKTMIDRIHQGTYPYSQASVLHECD